MPPADLPTAIDDRPAAVAFSLAQSATGQVAPIDDIVTAAASTVRCLVANATKRRAGRRWTRPLVYFGRRGSPGTHSSYSSARDTHVLVSWVWMPLGFLAAIVRANAPGTMMLPTQSSMPVIATKQRIVPTGSSATAAIVETATDFCSSCTVALGSLPAKSEWRVPGGGAYVVFGREMPVVLPTSRGRRRLR
ncbi:hypothetical protein AB0K48_20720 [Nonomuraea sp. NPDC055795]